MTGTSAFLGATIFDGVRNHDRQALLVSDGLVTAIIPASEIPRDALRCDLPGGILAPGYVDLQVNGGGGVMFNDAPTVDTLRTIAAAHAGLGATTILPTLITDTPARTAEAIDATALALAEGVPGIAGLHLEGPHLCLARKGAHDGSFIRAMSDSDLTTLLDAAKRLPVLMVTLAPEAVTNAQIGALSRAGVIVALGHTDAGFAECAAACAAGAQCVTHLFNAMRPLGSREPGTVGAALTLGGFSAGLIADGIHVHPETVALALRAKRGPGRIYLVSDAMATAGSGVSEFVLNGRKVLRAGGRLTLEDGTLAGAHLDLSRAVRNVMGWANLPPETALAMATSVPGGIIGQQGTLRPGARADFVHLDAEFTLAGVWQRGARVPAA